MSTLASINFLDAATQAARAGLSVLPCVADGTDAGKRPLPFWRDDTGNFTWKPAQSERPGANLLNRWYEREKRTSLGTVTGAVSDNLEAFDCDDASLYPAILEAADAAGLGPLVRRITNGYSDRTPGGYRWLWRCEKITGNLKLATRPDADGKVQVLIETRGEGGYAILAPSNGKSHPSGKPYVRLAGDFSSIATISPEERRDLFAFFKTFDVVKAKEPPVVAPRAGRADPTPGDRPGDDFNARETWPALLEAAGWQFVYTRNEGDYWRRPGKREGISACTNWQGKDCFYCWSSSTAFEIERPYSKFAFYATHHHGGDFKAATKALSAKGYGEPRRQRKAEAADPPPAAQPLGTPVKNQQFPLTETGNAERFALQHGDSVRYCWEWKTWLVWDGTRWKPDYGAASSALAKDTVRRIYAEAGTAKTQEEAAAIAKHAMRSESKKARESALALAQSEPGIPIEPASLDTHPWLLNCRNGTLDLQTGELRQHAQQDLLTKRVEIDYDPKATAPIWLDFLTRIFDGNWDVINFMQRAIGYSITSSTREQCFFILHGSGSNGKSTLLDVILTLLGDDYGIHCDAELLLVKHTDAHTTERADLFGKRLITVVETGDGRRLAENFIKQMTGGDRIRARKMRQDSFQFTPEFKLFLATNHRPEIRGTDLAIWRRVKLIPFDVAIPDDEKDLMLPFALKKEIAGILAWCVRGCLDWQKNGLQPPATVLAATQDYRTNMDRLAEFLDDHCVIDANQKVSVAILYRIFCDWCEEHGEKPEPQRTFGQRLGERGFARRRSTNNAHFWFGIGLASDLSD